jgi:hypothetical protein
MNSSVRVARRGSVWLAWGYHHDDDASTRRKLHTSDTVLVGSGFNALVFGSADDGRTWTSVAAAENCTIRALFLGDDNQLSLLLTDSSVLRERLRVEGQGTKTARLVSTSDPIQRVKVREFPSWMGWIEFIDGEKGSFGGRNYFRGYVDERTIDGGRTWKPSDGATEDEHLVDISRLGSGAWIRVRYWRPPDSVDVRRENGFQPLRAFETKIHDHHVDAAGRLIVRLENAEVWALSADGETWTRLTDVSVSSY